MNPCLECAVRRNCAFGQTPDAELAQLAPRIRQRIFHRGDLLVDEGAVATHLRVVKLGTVVASCRGVDGRSRPLGVVSRGFALGLFGAFAMPSPSSCVALGTTRVCELAIATLQELGACGPGLIGHLMRAVAQNFAALAAWSTAMRLPGAINQLAYVVLLLADANHSPVIELPSHAALGELLGTRRETIARALAKLESEGSIERRERKRCLVLREALLQRIALATV